MIDPALLQTITWGEQWDNSQPITYYFDDANSTRAWQANEIAAYESALEAWSNVADLTFTRVFTEAEAVFVEQLFSDADDQGFLGFHEVPNAVPGQATGAYNIDGFGWDSTGLQEGGLGFSTLIHEIGHGLGLAHPHDAGGTSTIMSGVTSDFGDFGDFDLNQTVFTVMSYNDGYVTRVGESFSFDFGSAASAMAIDVGAIQAIYGANATHNAGANQYFLPNPGAPSEGWKSIWDTGGIDELIYNGSDSTIIDLNAATLDYSETGGGTPSYVFGAFGGFTIANGVEIENASGGTAADLITGNALANTIAGNDGSDVIAGREGGDNLSGGEGADFLYGDYALPRPSGIGLGSGTYTKVAGAGNDSLATAIDVSSLFSLSADPNIANATSVPHVTVSGVGDDTVDYYAIQINNTGVNLTFDIDNGDGAGSITDFDSYIYLYDTAGNLIAENDDGAAADTGSLSDFDSSLSAFVAGAGTYYIGVEEFDGSIPTDATYDLHISVGGEFNLPAAPAIGGSDTLIGGGGDDLLAGGLGDDQSTGGIGADTFVWDAFDPNVAQADTITDFTPGTDRIDLGTTGPASFEVLQNHLLREIGGEAQLRSAWNGNLQTTTLTGVTASALGAGDVIFDTNTAGRTTTGTSGGDQLYGGLGGDNLTGGDGADLLVGDAGNDILNGEAGTDRFDGGAGADTFNGGADTDRVDYNVATTLILDGTGVGGAGSSAEALGDTFNSIEHIVGSQLGDTITLDTTVFQVSGRGGDDTLTGSAAANQINGGDGADIINGGGGSDLLFGNAGADNITIISSAPGDRAYAFGGDGNDQIFGGDGNDRLLGEADDDDIDGGAGNDSIEGGSGADDLEGGAGNDRFFDDDGAASGDTYTDTSGFDQIFYSGGGTFDFSAPGADTYTTDIEWVQFTSGSTVTGTANVDRFGGSSAVDTLNGGDGNDWLQGRAGADIINGDGGNDRLDGGSGTDTIRGGTGSDQLTGGADADTFFYAASDIDAVDVINDFAVGTDLIGIDGASFGLTVGALDPSQFVTDFGNVTGTDTTFIFNESLDRLYVDTDGTGTGSAQLMAIFQGDPTLTEDDFLIL